MTAKQTPLPDLLDQVPEDIVLGIPGDEPVFPSYTNIPIGKHARQAAAELRRLSAELERERMRLAACGVVALADTPDSAKHARQMHPDYESAACQDVARRVDECISLRTHRDALLEALRAAVADWDEEVSKGRWLDAARAAIKKAEEGEQA